MRMFKRRKSLGSRKTGLMVWLVPLALAGLLVWWGVPKLDWGEPWVRLLAPPEQMVLGAKTSITVKAGDADSGLREVRVAVTQGGQEKVVLNRAFPPGGEPGVEEEIPVIIEARALGLKEGQGVLTVIARDRSWHNFFRGRTRTLTKEVVIDLVPVNLTFLSVNHLLHCGGTGVLVYHLNKEVKASGVRVGGFLYRGFPRPGGEPGDYVVLFPVPLEPERPLQIELVAQPRWGREVKRTISLNLKPRRWRQDELNLSEAFLRRVAAAFGAGGEPVQGFLSVNRELRRANHEKVREICRESQPKQLWEGAFQRFRGKPMARFGDQRTYTR